jgi:hypothetical protein
MESEARSERERLTAAVMAMIDAGSEADPKPFETLALEVFAFQYENNRPYREFCDAKKVTPAKVSGWPEIPAFPTQAFKEDLVTSFPLEEAVLALCTSGTTSNQRGKILRDELGKQLALAANRVMTHDYLFPDFEVGRRCRLLILCPSPEMAPSMGMSYGMEQTRKAFGTGDSRYLLDWTGTDVRGLIDGLDEAEASGAPVALLGATSAYVHFFNAARKKGLSYQLPAGSRVCDGGGYRGRFGEVSRDDYYGMCEEIFGVPRSHCVNTLGMGESATNYFDNVLREWARGDSDAPRKKPMPPWARVTAVSLEDLSPLPAGDVGLLRHFDVANLPMVLAVQTDNLGVCFEDGGFEILGRAQVVDGNVVPLPSERVVGPMGDTRVFQMLEAYVNFSIDFKMGRVTGKPVKKAEAAASGPATDEPMKVGPESEMAELPDSIALSCPAVIDELVAAADDPEALARAESAIGRKKPKGGDGK